MRIDRQLSTGWMRRTRSTPVTLAELEAIIETETQAIFPVAGDCLTGAGVVNGGWVAVDFTRYPKPPRYKNKGGDGSADLCLCNAVFPGQSRPAIMCKEYSGVWGSWQMVGTHYKCAWDEGEFRPNLGMRAERIFGVIFASWDQEGRLLWERLPSEFAVLLGAASTIHGSNVGDPMTVQMG